ncbi:MAG: hypothetical protein K2Q32_06580 [Alphaproteobacteria bacterium]|nr:hypothetical protein [Alphaproteobacteria bacterium]
MPAKAGIHEFTFFNIFPIKQANKFVDAACAGMTVRVLASGIPPILCVIFSFHLTGEENEAFDRTKPQTKPTWL